MTQNATWVSLLTLIVGSPITFGWAEKAETSLPYVEALRRQGMSDLAVDYLQGILGKGDLAPEDRPDLEFELAASLVAASRSSGELPEREKGSIRRTKHF